MSIVRFPEPPHPDKAQPGDPGTITTAEGDVLVVEVQGAKADTRACTCHPDDAPMPCPRKFAAHHCWRAAVYEETRKAIIELKNRDTSVAELKFLDYLKRVERALDGTF